MNVKYGNFKVKVLQVSCDISLGLRELFNYT